MTSRAALLVAPAAAATLLVASAADGQTGISSFYVIQGFNEVLLTPPVFGANGGTHTVVFQGNYVGVLQGAIAYGRHRGVSGSIRIREGSRNYYGGVIVAATRPQYSTRHQPPGSHASFTQGRNDEIRKLGNGVNIARTMHSSIAHDQSGVLAKLNTVSWAVPAGQFAPVGPNAHVSGYIGFHGGSEYAWLKIKVTNNAEGIPTLLEFVKASDGYYGEVGDSSIATPSAIPEPASVPGGLALLALGAAGVREMRRRRKLAV